MKSVLFSDFSYLELSTFIIILSVKNEFLIKVFLTTKSSLIKYLNLIFFVLVLGWHFQQFTNVTSTSYKTFFKFTYILFHFCKKRINFHFYLFLLFQNSLIVILIKSYMFNLLFKIKKTKILHSNIYIKYIKLDLSFIKYLVHYYLLL